MSKHSNKIVSGVDIGGSQVAAALVDMEIGKMIPGSFHHRPVNATLFMPGRMKKGLPSDYGSHSFKTSGPE